MTTIQQDIAGYSPTRFRRDLTAGLAVATLAVPQSMAYATIADINPIYGLYSAIVVTIIASVFNSSSRLIHGPTNAICIMFADMQLTHVMADYGIATDPANFIRVVFLLSAMVGAIQLLSTVFRLGYLANFISPSVIVGFTLGAAVLIVAKQAPKSLGIDLPDVFPVVTFAGFEISEEMPTLRLLAYTFDQRGEMNGATAGIAALCAAITLIYRAWRRRAMAAAHQVKGFSRLLGRGARYVPGPLVAIIAAACVVAFFDLGERGVEHIELTRGTLPPLSLPMMHLGLARALLPGAFAIALVGLIEAVGTAKGIANRSREPFNANGQLLAEGLANFAGSFFSSFAGSSSFTRTALNVDVGGATRFAGIASGLFVALYLVLLSPLFKFIPLAALSGVLVAIGITLVRSQPILQTVRGSRSEAVIVVATALWSILFSLEIGIMIGAILSVLFYMPHAATLYVRQLIRDSKGIIRERDWTEPLCSRLRIVDIEGALFFGALPGLEKALGDLAEQEVEFKIIRLHNTNHIDAAACNKLIDFIREEQDKGVRVILCGIRRQHFEMLDRQGVLDLLGDENFYIEENLSRTSTVVAVSKAYLEIGPHDCDLCTGNKNEDPDTLSYTI